MVQPVVQILQLHDLNTLSGEKPFSFFEWDAVEGGHGLSRFTASSARSLTHLLTRLDASGRPSSGVLYSCKASCASELGMTHGSYLAMFGVRQVCFSEFGPKHARRHPAGGHFEGLWQHSFGPFSHKGANCPHVVALLWSFHLEMFWIPGPTWWGCNRCLILLTKPLTGWKYGLLFPFLLPL